MSKVRSPNEDWGFGGPGDGIPADNFSALFETCLVMDRPATIVFTIGSDDGSRLFIDDKEIVDLWSGHAFTTREQSVPIAEGVHSLRLEYFELGGMARLSLAARVENPPLNVPFYRVLRLPSAVTRGCTG